MSIVGATDMVTLTTNGMFRTQRDSAVQSTSEFDEELVAMAAIEMSAFGEDATYYPVDGSDRDIKVIVNRQGLDKLTSTGVTSVVTISALNDSDSGIPSDCVDCGGDKISLAWRIGETPALRRITKVIKHDVGMVTLEVK